MAKGHITPLWRACGRSRAAWARHGAAWALVLAGLGAGFLGAAPALAQAQPGANASLPLESAANGGIRRWQVAGPAPVSLQAQANAAAPSVALAPPGALLANHGCVAAEGAAWCEVQLLPGRARGHVERDALHPARGPDGHIPMGPDTSALRARRQDFDATTDIPCTQIRDEPWQVCTLSVARGGGGDAMAVARFANGFARHLTFTHGMFIGGNTTMSGTGQDIDWHRQDGLYHLRVDDQRYQIPEAMIPGP